MKNIFKFSILILSTVLISCAGPYTIENSGSTINLSIDDPFEIELMGNPSTGYSWQVVTLDSTVISRIGDAEFKANDDKIGSAGVYTFKFKTISAGQSNLLLVYKRAWDEHALHDKVFEMKVVVGTMGRILEE